ncbi:MAG: hypothetical protein DHS20C08_10150 [Rhodomicrobium sp.]|nr:MAG: hypothetical protein DHS20C08_10150 [Rhodomicrobium sp.]
MPLLRTLSRLTAKRFLTAMMIGIVPTMTACTNKGGNYSSPPSEVERRGSH